jgi:hypothetical protein
MKGNIPTAVTQPQTKLEDEATCLMLEEYRNGGPIDWQVWLLMSNITPKQAAKLAFCIDPIQWNGKNCAFGSIPDDLRTEIQRFSQFLKGIKQSWTLQEIANRTGELPYTMMQALKAQYKAQDDELKRRAEAQSDDMKRAGRYTLQAVANELADKSGGEVSRWLEVIIDAVKDGNLALRNPKDYNDTLPYKVPANIRQFYEQVSANDVNAWLAANPKFGDYHLGDAKPMKRVSKPRAGPSSDAAWMNEARRIADELQEIDVSTGSHTSIRDMAKRVAEKMGRKKFFGPRGAKLSEGTILREALQGGRWVRKS